MTKCRSQILLSNTTVQRDIVELTNDILSTIASEMKFYVCATIGRVN